ncbi:SLC13 family permease [Gemmiger formicilis]|uniref:SLC13 family permease n=1 Tax=Gemmiger formicilis TaxID=745368 RepID=UPI0031F6A5F6
MELTGWGRVLLWLQRAKAFIKSEVVLTVAVVLAILSSIAVPPDAAWAGYIDWDTLALLFSLMAVTKGLQGLGLFDALGAALLRRMAATRQMVLVLVFLPFVFSMLITNDVSLITFVPFALTVLHMAGQDRLVIPTVVLQTAAANLGSMLTPMGNPQNLYLYNRSGMSFGAFCALMLPYVVLSGVCIAVLCVLPRSVPVHTDLPATPLGDKRKMALCGVGALLCLGCIAKVLPPLGVAAVTAVVLIIGDRPLLARIDYSLLGTFIAFFVFIGNMGRIESFQNFLSGILAGHEVAVAVLASQVISNVPAALLLSGYSSAWPQLIVGCNLGGLGTLIASMASLISYKLVAKQHPEMRPRYFAWFTLCNVGLLALLLVESLFV